MILWMIATKLYNTFFNSKKKKLSLWSCSGSHWAWVVGYLHSKGTADRSLFLTREFSPKKKIKKNVKTGKRKNDFGDFQSPEVGKKKSKDNQILIWFFIV
jgi:hypothetical protein